MKIEDNNAVKEAFDLIKKVREELQAVIDLPDSEEKIAKLESFTIMCEKAAAKGNVAINEQYEMYCDAVDALAKAKKEVFHFLANESVKTYKIRRIRNIKFVFTDRKKIIQMTPSLLQALYTYFSFYLHKLLGEINQGFPGSNLYIVTGSVKAAEFCGMTVDEFVDGFEKLMDSFDC